MDLGRLLRNLWAARKRPRWWLAMAVALASDALSFGLELLTLGLGEPAQLAVDFGTALVLALILGWRWSLLLPLGVEAVPALALFPTWALAVAALAATDAAPERPQP